MKKMKNTKLKKFIDYLVIVIIGVILLYPIFWMFFATFKSNEEIYSSIKLFPKSFDLKYYIAAGKEPENLPTRSFSSTRLSWWSRRRS